MILKKNLSKYLFFKRMVGIQLFKTIETPPWNLEILVAQMVKNLPAMQETRVWSLGQEDPTDKEMPTHSSMLAWEIPLKMEPGRLQSMGLQKNQTWLSD